MLAMAIARIEAALCGPDDRLPRFAAVAIAAGGWVERAIVARPGPGAPPAPDAPFPLYSITKTFLAAAALRLVTRGALALDAPVWGWLPWAPHGERITLRQLLSHTSGLPDYGGLPAYHAAVRAGAPAWTDEEVLARTGAEALRFEPGEGWAYSNVGYLLVRRLVEAAGGATLGEVLEAELLGPLALRDTFLPSDGDLPRLVLGPSRYLGDGEPVGVPGRYRLGWVAHATLAGSAADAARFLDALLGGEVLPPALLAEMCALREVGPVPGHPLPRPSYGLGLMGDASGDPLGHAGGGPGASTAVYRRAGAEAVTVAVLTDGEDGGAERLALAVLDALP
jgi:CubicO group peptidase (beta-lactamase class C family)